jgi:hypothetical protein
MSCLKLPLPVKVRGRPKGNTVTVLGKSKKIQLKSGKSKRKARPPIAVFLEMVANPNVVECALEMMAENVPNGIVDAPLGQLKVYFTHDTWLSVDHLIKAKKLELTTCPVCHLPDDGKLKMVRCDSSACCQWFHFPCVGVCSADLIENDFWMCHNCR